MRLLWRRSRGPRPKHRGEGDSGQHRLAQLGPHKGVGTEVTCQQVGDGGEPKPKVVVGHLTGGAAVGEYVHLLFLDPVFHFVPAEAAVGPNDLAVALADLRDDGFEACSFFGPCLLAKEVFLATVVSQQGVEAEFVAIIDVLVPQEIG